MGKGDDAEPRDAVAGRTVEIRSAADEKAARARRLAVARLGGLIVIRVSDLDRIQSGGGERGNHVIAARHARMRE